MDTLETILTPVNVAILNAARTILKDCADLTSDTPNHYRPITRAETAEHALFKFVLSAYVFGPVALTRQQLHNYTDAELAELVTTETAAAAEHAPVAS